MRKHDDAKHFGCSMQRSPPMLGSLTTMRSGCVQRKDSVLDVGPLLLPALDGQLVIQRPLRARPQVSRKLCVAPVAVVTEVERRIQPPCVLGDQAQKPVKTDEID